MGNRVYWASKSLHFAECGTSSFTAAHGVQQAGTTTRFNLDQVFELGQIEIYELAENVPDVELTTEKVLDGYPLLYHLATKNSTSATLAGRSTKRATVGLAIFDETQDSASGTPVARCVMSGMYVSSLQYQINVDGPSTESITLVGNNRVWNQAFSFTSLNNDDQPYAIAGSGGVQQRQDIIFGACDTSVSQPSATILPLDIPGLTASGCNVEQAGGAFGAHVRSIRTSTNLGRESLFELGKREPYHRYVGFPTEVTTEIEVLSITGDQVSASETAESNLTNRRIWIRMREGTKIDLGSNNKLQNVTMGGANAGQNGGNDTLTYTYVNYNRLTVYHPQDPSGL